MNSTVFLAQNASNMLYWSQEHSYCHRRNAEGQYGLCDRYSVPELLWQHVVPSQENAVSWVTGRTSGL